MRYFERAACQVPPHFGSVIASIDARKTNRNAGKNYSKFLFFVLLGRNKRPNLPERKFRAKLLGQSLIYLQ